MKGDAASILLLFIILLGFLVYLNNNGDLNIKVSDNSGTGTDQNSGNGGSAGSENSEDLDMIKDLCPDNKKSSLIDLPKISGAILCNQNIESHIISEIYVVPHKTIQDVCNYYKEHTSNNCIYNTVDNGCYIKCSKKTDTSYIAYGILVVPKEYFGSDMNKEKEELLEGCSFAVLNKIEFKDIGKTPIVEEVPKYPGAILYNQVERFDYKADEYFIKTENPESVLNYYKNSLSNCKSTTEPIQGAGSVSYNKYILQCDNNIEISIEPPISLIYVFFGAPIEGISLRVEKITNNLE